MEMKVNLFSYKEDIMDGFEKMMNELNESIDNKKQEEDEKSKLTKMLFESIVMLEMSKLIVEAQHKEVERLREENEMLKLKLGEA